MVKIRPALFKANRSPSMPQTPHVHAINIRGLFRPYEPAKEIKRRYETHHQLDQPLRIIP